MADNKKPASAPAKKADNKTPRQRFLDVGTKRANKAIKSVRNLNNIANRKSYEYTEAEANKLLSALRSELTKVENTFKAALSGTGGKAAEEGFTFA